MCSKHKSFTDLTQRHLIERGAACSEAFTVFFGGFFPAAFFVALAGCQWEDHNGGFRVSEFFTLSHPLLS
jgi:hypothetical protein